MKRSRSVHEYLEELRLRPTTLAAGGLYRSPQVCSRYFQDLSATTQKAGLIAYAEEISEELEYCGLAKVSFPLLQKPTADARQVSTCQPLCRPARAGPSTSECDAGRELSSPSASAGAGMVDPRSCEPVEQSGDSECSDARSRISDVTRLGPPGVVPESYEPPPTSANSMASQFLDPAEVIRQTLDARLRVNVYRYKLVHALAGGYRVKFSPSHTQQTAASILGRIASGTATIFPTVLPHDDPRDTLYWYVSGLRWATANEKAAGACHYDHANCQCVAVTA